MTARYWVFSVERADHDVLRRCGFISFAPRVSEYAFLEESSENETLLKRSFSYGLEAVCVGDEMQTISAAELSAFGGSDLSPGDCVRAIEGPASGLEGVVDEVQGDNASCTFQGYQRTYHVEVGLLEIEQLNKGASDR